MAKLIKGKVLLKNKNLALTKHEGMIFGFNRRTKRKLSSEGLIVANDTSLFDNIFIDENGQLCIVFKADVDELFEFAKKAKNDKKKFNGVTYFRHFNPELTFFFGDANEKTDAGTSKQNSSGVRDGKVLLKKARKKV